MKINFFGTDIFACIILQNLIDTGFDVVCAVTKPNDYVGRKKELTESKIAILAKNLNIPVVKPAILKDFEVTLARFNGDINVVCEYGKIIPDSVLYLPKFKSVNIHGSLLPQYRGASPIQFSLMNGDNKTGVTLMEMDHEMDHGNIIATSEYNIKNTDTEPILREELAKLGADLLIKELKNLEINSKLSNSIIQDHDSATYTRLIKKEDGFVDLLKDSSDKVLNKFRAFIKWPGIYIVYKEKRVKLTDISLNVFNFNFIQDENIFPFLIKDKELYLICADSKLIRVNKLQFEAKNEITYRDFINQIK
ncbi:MAG: methionyl-tRNA formyltransferase [Patescibacteria group bacterium]